MVLQWARFKEFFEGLCQIGKLYHVGKRPEGQMVLSFAILYVCACNCAMYVGLQKNNPLGHYMYSYMYRYLYYVECSHFAREGSMLYTENQSDEY